MLMGKVLKATKYTADSIRGSIMLMGKVLKATKYTADSTKGSVSARMQYLIQITARVEVVCITFAGILRLMLLT